MHRSILAAVTVLTVAGFVLGQRAPARRPAGPAAVEHGISLYFSPKGGCTDAIVGEILKARQTLEVQAYSFTSAPIAGAVKAAHDRGVMVRVVLDESQQTAKYSSATFLHNAGIGVMIDAKHAIAHNKIIIVDGATVLTGSFNFSKAAEESNAENLLVITGKPQLTAAYLANFDEHLKHAVPYVAPANGEDDR